MHFYCAISAHFLYLTAFFTIITNISCYPVHYPLPHAQMSSIDALYCTCAFLPVYSSVFLFVFLYALFFIHIMMYPDCSIAMQFPQSSNTSNSHKMAYSHHFIPFSVFGVSISINCLFVQAQTQFILLTLTS